MSLIGFSKKMAGLGAIADATTINHYLPDFDATIADRMLCALAGEMLTDLGNPQSITWEGELAYFRAIHPEPYFQRYFDYADTVYQAVRKASLANPLLDLKAEIARY